MKDKTKQIREMNFSSIERKKVFEAKQRIAVEKFGNMFEDDTFFALELEFGLIFFTYERIVKQSQRALHDQTSGVMPLKVTSYIISQSLYLELYISTTLIFKQVKIYKYMKYYFSSFFL